MGSNSLANAFRNVYRGVASMLETGSWQVEGAANEIRTAGVILDRVDEEVEIRAQETLDDVNEALTEYGKLQSRETMLSSQVADWQQKATDAAAKAKKAKEGTPERTKWGGLAREALIQKAKFASQLKVVQDALSKSKPDANKALELVQEIGFTREQALSERDALQVKDATVQARLKLANARKSWGTGSGPGQLLEEARRKMEEASAKAVATETVEAAMPLSADRVAAEISREQAKSSVDEELAALMAN